MAASHQLKSPLAIVQWCLQSLQESTSLTPADRELVNKSLIQANAMSQLIGDMLHVFRLQSKRDKGQQLLPVDLGAVIDQVMRQYELMAHNRQVHLLRGPIEALPLVLADEAYLKQAIINLVDNAIKYSRPGGRVEVSAGVSPDGTVFLKVSDQGIGIPEAEQSRLFTEFFRGQEASRLTHEGTGLGLVLVRQIVEGFGGKVVVESTVGKGSAFTVRLPSASSGR